MQRQGEDEVMSINSVLIKDKETLKLFCSLKSHPENLTNEMVRKLGKVYLESYPNNRNFLDKIFIPHNNQNLATKLCACNKPTAYERWRYLAEYYKHLPNNPGKLANLLIQIFSCAFNKHVSLSVSGHDITFSPRFVSIQLTGIVGDYYARQFYAKLNKHNLIEKHIDSQETLRRCIDESVEEEEEQEEKNEGIPLIEFK